MKRENRMGKENRVWKCLTSVLLAVVLCIAMLPVTAVRSYASVGDKFLDDSGIYYQILTEPSGSVNGTLEVAGGGKTSTAAGKLGETDIEEVHIPETVTYGGNVYDVVSIAQSAFQNSSSIQLVTIPASITSIGASAFASCSNLTSVTLADGLTVIGQNMFGMCTSLTSIYVPNSLTTIGGVSLYGSGITEITFADDITNIEYLFTGCAALETVIVPATIQKATSAFAFCTGLKTVVFEEGLTAINDSMFYNCTSLEKVVIPASVKTIEASAFAYCTSLQKVTIYYSGKQPEIAESAFANASSELQITMIPIDSHEHAVCGDSACGEHTDEVSYTVLTQDLLDSGALSGSGNYYLGSGSLTATADITIPSGETVNICLNGYSIDMQGYQFVVEEGGILNICDCQADADNESSEDSESSEESGNSEDSGSSENGEDGETVADISGAVVFGESGKTAFVVRGTAYIYDTTLDGSGWTGATSGSTCAVLVTGSLVLGDGTTVSGFDANTGSGPNEGRKGVISVYASGILNLLDGAIITDCSSQSGIVAVFQTDKDEMDTKPTFHMTGGSITGNTISEGAVNNMGIVWNWCGNVNISGGTISVSDSVGCHCAVYTQGNNQDTEAVDTVITGGTIENTEGYAIGVSDKAYLSLQIGGTPEISGNETAHADILLRGAVPVTATADTTPYTGAALTVDKEGFAEGDTIVSNVTDANADLFLWNGDARYTLARADSSMVLSMDDTIPAFTGLTDGAVYCTSVSFTVSDDNVVTVTVDEAPVEADADGVYTISGDDLQHTVVATDRAGNAVQATVTVSSDHVWTYTVVNASDAEATISRECQNCGITASVTISAPTGEQIYDGASHDAVLSYTGALSDSGDLSVTYEKDGTIVTDTTQAGTYTASITFGDQTVSVRYTVNAAYKYGDVDFNGAVEAVDALEILRACVGLKTLTAEQELVADVDGNGAVEATDALYVLRNCVGLIDSFPVESPE